MLIKGSNLSPAQRRMVLDAFVYRWTSENPQRERAWANATSRPTVPLVSDDEWIAAHAFHFTTDGSRLMRNRQHAEPSFLAD